LIGNLLCRPLRTHSAPYLRRDFGLIISHGEFTKETNHVVEASEHAEDPASPDLAVTR
jgi:hypothetical protein